MLFSSTVTLNSLERTAITFKHCKFFKYKLINLNTALPTYIASANCGTLIGLIFFLGGPSESATTVSKGIVCIFVFWGLFYLHSRKNGLQLGWQIDFIFAARLQIPKEDKVMGFEK